MKVLIIDVSYNTNLNKVLSFINKHNDADYIYLYDYEYSLFNSTDEAIEELTTFRNDYFCYPCAHYDIVTKLLGKLRNSNQECNVYLCTDSSDNCSIYSSEDAFDNYVYHISLRSSLSLHGINQLNSIDIDVDSFTYSRDSLFSGFLDKLLSVLHLNNYEEEVDYIE